jgi:hypothetical protein
MIFFKFQSFIKNLSETDLTKKKVEITFLLKMFRNISSAKLNVVPFLKNWKSSDVSNSFHELEKVL